MQFQASNVSPFNDLREVYRSRKNSTTDYSLQGLTSKLIMSMIVLQLNYINYEERKTLSGNDRRRCKALP